MMTRATPYCPDPSSGPLDNGFSLLASELSQLAEQSNKTLLSISPLVQQIRGDANFPAWQQLAAERDRLVQLRDQLLELLQTIEWHAPISNSSPSCPCCGALQHWGHDEMCELQAVLQGAVNSQPPHEPRTS